MQDLVDASDGCITNGDHTTLISHQHTLGLHYIQASVVAVDMHDLPTHVEIINKMCTIPSVRIFGVQEESAKKAAKKVATLAS